MPLHRADLKRQEIRGFHTCFPSKTGIGQPLRPSAEIGRQARLRAVCFRTCGFESHLGHVFISYVGESWKLSTFLQHAQVVKLVDTQSSGGCASACEFESRPGHHITPDPVKFRVFFCPQFLQLTGARVYTINTLPIKALAFMGFEEIYPNATLLTCRSLASNTPKRVYVARVSTEIALQPKSWPSRMCL